MTTRNERSHLAETGFALDRRALARMAEELYLQGVLTPAGGNLSVRLDGDDVRILITPSGLFKGGLHAEDMVLTDGEGLQVGEALPGRVPSVEAGVHAAVYRACPDVMAIVHGHPAHATALATMGLPIEPVLVESARYVGIPRVPPLAPGSPELADAVATGLTRGPAVLLVGHGLFAAGESLRAAADVALELDHVCRVMLLMRGGGLGRDR
jgi:L-fuculose-phosphate aldolase